MSNKCFQLLTIFKCLKQAVLMADVWLQIQTGEPIKSLRIESNFTKRPWQEMIKEDTVHIKNMQSNKMNIFQHTAEAFYNPLWNHEHFHKNLWFNYTFFLSNCNRLQFLRKMAIAKSPSLFVSQLSRCCFFLFFMKSLLELLPLCLCAYLCWRMNTVCAVWVFYKWLSQS